MSRLLLLRTGFSTTINHGLASFNTITSAPRIVGNRITACQKLRKQDD
jgi:hypothetical protein